MVGVHVYEILKSEKVAIDRRQRHLKLCARTKSNYKEVQTSRERVW